MNALTALTPLFLAASCRAPLCTEFAPQEVAQIEALADADQEARARLLNWSREHPRESVPPEIYQPVHDADERSREFLHGLVDDGRWPCISEVGLQVAGDAWLLAQHADEDPQLQARALDLMAPLVDMGEVKAGDFALLTDRVLVAQGRDQLYGTQYKTESRLGVLHFGPATPIEDLEHVDERRAAAGLLPLAHYEAKLRQVYGVPEDAPGLR